MVPQRDVLVIGAGPAGLGLAAAAAAHGLSVAVLAPQPEAPWPNSFGSWAEGAQGLGLDDAVTMSFPHPLVTTSKDAPLRLAATYWRFDTRLLQESLLDRCRSSGVELLQGQVERAFHERECSSVELGTATETARLLVDATGSNSSVSRRDRSTPRAYQSAYGVWLEGESPFAHGEMRLMDFGTADEPGEPPTFLYGMPEGEDRIFLQETCLASPRPVSMALLAARLERRIATLGVGGLRRLGEEHCLIPMGVGFPVRGQSLLSFGAAAGLVHPATGYQLTRALRAALSVAECLAKHLDDGREVAIEQAGAALWPASRRQEFALYESGLELLLRLRPRELRHFITAFFALPTPQWLGFMEGTLSVPEIASAMWQVFTRAPARLRVELLRGGAASGARALLSTVSFGENHGFA